LSKLPRAIWVLGFVAMFMDISSELVHSLLPVFMSSVLGASMLTIGVVEGAAEALAAISKAPAGVLSDHWGKRKSLVALGYGLSAFTKPVFPIASSIWAVAAARFADRIGKGIRGAPRDALVADIAPAHLRGAAFGLRQALDSVGAFLGPALAVIFMTLTANDIRAVLWVAVAPAVFGVLLLVWGVEEPERAADAGPARSSIHWRDAQRLGREFWVIVALGSVFTLARFSEAFLVLRAQDVGLDIALVPAVMVVMSGVYAASAYPAGRISDRFSPRTLLPAGLLALIVADLVLATASSIAMVLTGAALWGLHMGITQGLFSKLVADAAPVELRGTAFGAYSLVTGVSMLLASVIAGALWTSLGPAATFFAGAGFSAAAALGLLAHRQHAAA
jgi:MFS family permease